MEAFLVPEGKPAPESTRQDMQSGGKTPKMGPGHKATKGGTQGSSRKPKEAQKPAKSVTPSLGKESPILKFLRTGKTRLRESEPDPTFKSEK